MITITTGVLQQAALKLLEALGQLLEGCAIAQGARLALHNGQVVAPIIDRPATAAVIAGKDTLMNRHLAGLCHDHQTISVNAHAYHPVGKARRDAVAVMLKGD